MRRFPFAVLLTAIAWMMGCSAPAMLTPLPDDKVALRYRIEQRTAEGEWVPVSAGKTFRRGEQVRFRFMSNTAGTLYVLNGSSSSMRPIFPGRDAQMERYLGLGTRIPAHRVGLWPRPDEGSALRFTGHEGIERFLLAYVPDALGATREVLAIPPGAEDWDFTAETTRVTTGRLGEVLFHYFDVKSK